MNSISLVTANTSIITSPVSPAVPLSADKAANSTPDSSTGASPASVVILGQDVKIPELTTYRSLGALNITNPGYTLEQ